MLGAPRALRDYGMPEGGIAKALEPIIKALPANNPAPVNPRQPDPAAAGGVVRRTDPLKEAAMATHVTIDSARTDGKPLAGARIEVWEADEDGLHDVRTATPDGPLVDATWSRVRFDIVLAPAGV
ncbi:hypothetical protein [Streptomyces sp. RG80]|uniref:hypothetical protein n=1 Tax=Streptomyces sp. RG80 TaxID=3157340 RepID=UPI00338FFC5A